MLLIRLCILNIPDFTAPAAFAASDFFATNDSLAATAAFSASSAALAAALDLADKVVTFVVSVFTFDSAATLAASAAFNFSSSAAFASAICVFETDPRSTTDKQKILI